MNKVDIQKSLEEKGYCMIQNVLNKSFLKAKANYFMIGMIVSNLINFIQKYIIIFKYHEL